MKKHYIVFLFLIGLFCTSCEREEPLMNEIMITESMSYMPYKLGDVCKFKSGSRTITLKVASVSSELGLHTWNHNFYCRHEFCLMGVDNKSSVVFVISINCPSDEDGRYNIYMGGYGSFDHALGEVRFYVENDSSADYSPIGNIQSNIVLYERGGTKKLAVYERNVGFTELCIANETFRLVK